jgi:hypothetical protein
LKEAINNQESSYLLIEKIMQLKFFRCDDYKQAFCSFHFVHSQTHYIISFKLSYLSRRKYLKFISIAEKYTRKKKEEKEE